MEKYDIIDEKAMSPEENGFLYCPINPECNGSNNGDCYDVICSVGLEKFVQNELNELKLI